MLPITNYWVGLKDFHTWESGKPVTIYMDIGGYLDEGSSKREVVCQRGYTGGIVIDGFFIQRLNFPNICQDL